MKKKIITVLATAGLTAGLVLASGGPAAASPACTTNGYGVTRSGSILSVPATSGGSLHCHLQEGYSNRAVWQLQYSITWCYRGYGESVLNIGVDGNFGPKTKAALRRVQQIERINVDGVYGPQTRDAMMHRQDSWEGDQDPNVCRKLSW
ncbi:peptidoglycan-binding domain-containing protein [Mumia sp. Pv 4-285]|uniref:peptidoglycan-binding domain-containing protein n=1 Tax=Mumia qirimensis TaxID=3234852 RepID=UPI00351D2775